MGLALGEVRVARSMFQKPRGVRVGALYWLRKDELEAQHRKLLTLQPKHSDLSPEPPAKYEVFVECGDMVGVPRFYGLRAFGEAPWKGPAPSPLAMNFAGTLAPRQIPAVDAAMEELARPGPAGGMLVLPCGYGKTVISLALVAKLGYQALVLVHKECLLDQWEERIRQFVPGVKIGKIQQDCVDLGGQTLNTATTRDLQLIHGIGPQLAQRIVDAKPPDGWGEDVFERLRALGVQPSSIEDIAERFDGRPCEIIMGMVQSLALKTYDATLFETLGTVVVDEAHHICARMFSRAMAKLPAQKVIGLSATPKRSDDLGFSLPWFLGPVLYQAERAHEHVEVRIHTYVPEHESGTKEIFARGGRLLMATMLTRMVRDAARQERVARLARAAVAEGRHVMIISERLELLDALHARLKADCPSMGKITGGMSQEERAESATCQVVLATYSMCAEGLDIPRLDTLILATPRSDVEQSVGRILRTHPDKAIPVVHDVLDAYSIFEKMGWKRKRYYRKSNFHITDITE